MKCLLVIIDGLADRPSPILGNRTPLQSAFTPNLDKLSSLGANGLMDPISPGLAPGSETAHYLIFGYQLADFPGRGVLEAIGEGVEFDDEDVVLITSFASVLPQGDRLKLLARYMPQEAEDCGRLAPAVPKAEIDGISFTPIYLRKGGGLLILKGDVSPDVTDADPFTLDLPVIKVQPMRDSPEFKKAWHTAEALNKYMALVHEVIKDHPVNGERKRRGAIPINFLLTKWASKKRPVEPFHERFGMRGAVIANPPFYHGIAKVLGMTPLALPSIEDPEEDLKARFALAEELFFKKGYDFIHIHTKVADDAAHKKDPLLKKEVIERLDPAFATLITGLAVREDVLTIVTADHATPSVGPLIHSGEAVPITFIGKNVLQDDVVEFNEKAAGRGSLGRFRSSELMNMVLNYTDRMNRHELRPLNRRVFYVPKEVEPFKL